MEKLRTVVRRIVLGVLIVALSFGLKENAKADEVTELKLELETYDYATHTVSLKWNQIEGAKCYTIMDTEITTEDTWITIEDVEYGTEYSWYIIALNSEGEVLSTSNTVELTMPGAVEEVKTTSLSAKKVSVYWTEVSGATSYEVYYKLSSAKKFTFLKETEGTRVKATVKDKKKYYFKVVPKYDNNGITIVGAGKNCPFNNNYFVSNDHQKYTYKEMQADINALCKKYSEYVSCSVIGTTINGNNIYDVVLGNPDAKKSLLVVCELHAREYVTTVTCMKQLEYYLKNYNSTVDGGVVADTFNECNVHYVMMSNPDGVSISQNKVSTWKGNANSVNLNRNFPYKFKKRGKKGGNDYTGPKAASENETKAIIELSKKLRNKKSFAVISYHAMGQIVFGSYHAKNKRVKKMIDKMYKVARNTTGYADAGRYDGGTSNGCYREYLIYGMKVPCITIEVGFTACPVEQKYYSSIYDKNKLVVLREARLL